MSRYGTQRRYSAPGVLSAGYSAPERNDTRYYNPLRSGGLNNFNDSGDVHILYTKSGGTPGEIEFVRQAATNVLDKNGLCGHVDIRVPAYDSLGGINTSRAGIHEMKYQIKQNDQVLYEYKPFTFDNLPGTPVSNPYGNLNNEYVYSSEYVYWATNDAFDTTTPNKYWNTMHKLNGSYNDNAVLNSEAKFPDGRYNVNIIVSDIADQNAEANTEVLLDNFAPYVKKLSVFQNNQRRYNSSWEHESGEMKLSPEGGERQTGDIKAGELITIIAEFSEEVTVQVQDSFVPMAPVDGMGNRLWEGNCLLNIYSLNT